MLLLPLLAMSVISKPTSPKHWSYQPTPTLGWNSWDCFGTTLTEIQAKAQADAMAKHLKPFGWNLFTVDIQWYEPHAQGHDYRPGAKLAMDGYGRLVPATTKFPSASGDHGFKPLADYVHQKGLRFGIHLMRGIPRQAVKENTPVLGTDFHATDIANIHSICAWNPDMYGVDLTKAGAQAYYDSLFQLYASWGVDFVKVDDISRPYNEGQKLEIEAIRHAIDKSGRPMVLSLSPGDTPIERGSHVEQFANQWRISDDFWDRWEPLYGMFGRLDKWTPHRHDGAWPDADMLPFGIVEFNRPTRFTQSEQILCMTLWSIARSPLILGADMTRLDPFTLGLLTNKEVLAVNQHSHNNRQLYRQGDLIAWVADVPNSLDKYLALFNAQSNHSPYDIKRALYQSPILKGDAGNEVAEIDIPLQGAKKLVLMVTDAGDGFAFDHSAWVDPTLTGPKGSLKLSGLKWTTATAGWGSVQKNLTVDNQPIIFKGEKVSGIGTHSPSVIEFDIPEGYDRFQSKGILTEGSGGKGSVEFVVLTEKARQDFPEESLVSVKLSDLGFTGETHIRDLWSHTDLGRFRDSFGQILPLHGAGLYRISPQH